MYARTSLILHFDDLFCAYKYLTHYKKQRPEFVSNSTWKTELHYVFVLIGLLVIGVCYFSACMFSPVCSLGVKMEPLLLFVVRPQVVPETEESLITKCKEISFYFH